MWIAADANGEVWLFGQQPDWNDDNGIWILANDDSILIDPDSPEFAAARAVAAIPGPEDCFPVDVLIRRRR